jgi:putative transposase
VTEGYVHDRNRKVAFAIEKARTYIFDRGYFDFTFFRRILDAGAHFITRIKRGVNVLRYEELPRHGRGVLRDRAVVVGTDPDAPLLRLVRYRCPETGRVYEFLTDRFDLGATAIADGYKARWQVETAQTQPTKTVFASRSIAASSSWLVAHAET